MVFTTKAANWLLSTLGPGGLDKSRVKRQVGYPLQPKNLEPTFIPLFVSRSTSGDPHLGQVTVEECLALSDSICSLR